MSTQLSIFSSSFSLLPVLLLPTLQLRESYLVHKFKQAHYYHGVSVCRCVEPIHELTAIDTFTITVGNCCIVGKQGGRTSAAELSYINKQADNSCI